MTTAMGTMFTEGRLTTEQSRERRSKKLIEEADRTVETMHRVADRLKRVTDLYREREDPQSTKDKSKG